MIEPLPWDSAHFGFAVARLVPGDLSDRALARAVGAARCAGIELLYWHALAARALPRELVARLGGRRVDCRHTYFLDPLSAPALPARTTNACRIRPWVAAEVTERLRNLAVLAGRFSRFRVDPGIPRERCEALFSAWIEQSAGGAMGDAILVAETHERAEPVVGLITVVREQAVGRIGLVAVADEAAGKGIGTALVTAALRCLCERGAEKALVVTQKANTPARRLYERCQFRLQSRAAVWHFWLQAAAHEQGPGLPLGMRRPGSPVSPLAAAHLTGAPLRNPC